MFNGAKIHFFAITRRFSVYNVYCCSVLYKNVETMRIVSTFYSTTSLNTLFPTITMYTPFSTANVFRTSFCPFARAIV